MVPSPSVMPNSVYHYPFEDLCSSQRLHPVLASHWCAGLLKAPDSHLQLDFYLIFYFTKQCQQRGAADTFPM